MPSPPLLAAGKRRIWLSLALAIGSLLVIAGVALHSMNQVLTGQTSHSQGFVPAKRLTTNFEREILNARIFFIYFVTIQKPQSLENGWIHYHGVESSLKQLRDLVAARPELNSLSEPSAKLQKDLDAYGLVLTPTLAMVKNGTLKGPAYDAQVKEWAARGAILVTDAGMVEKLAFAQSEADTNHLIGTLKHGEKLVVITFLLAILASLGATLALARRA